LRVCGRDFVAFGGFADCIGRNERHTSHKKGSTE